MTMQSLFGTTFFTGKFSNCSAAKIPGMLVMNFECVLESEFPTKESQYGILPSYAFV